ncbi:MAG: thiamine phosphate synthase, partial [Erysipelotrichaceae bacterium]|nr:thiamine phosphate synthase [Erysipelotrichaceae bacterium]
MKLDRQDMLLYAITDRHWLRGESLATQVQKALEGGVTFVQLREKELSEEVLMHEAMEIRDICRAYHVPFVIDDNVDLAVAIDADGVHLGQGDMSPVEAREMLGDSKIIGVTAKTVEQALKAQSEGADYIGTGAAFVTTSKQDTWTIPHTTIRAIVDACSIPVVAIGGISYANVDLLRETRVAGVAVISAIFGLDDITEGTQLLKDKVVRLFGGRRVALTIAGSDSSGGAGIQADLKTMVNNGVYGMSAITALTAQNTTGVTGVMDVTPDFLEQQLDAVFTDIYPDAIKVGMVSNPDLVKVISYKLQEYQAKNIVIDPVMVATSG